MEDIKTTPQVEAPKAPKTRSKTYTVLISILLVLLVAAFAAAGYWVYLTYNTTPDTASNQSVSSSVTRSKEEKELDAITTDLKKDDELATDDLSKETDDLNSIDVSGI